MVESRTLSLLQSTSNIDKIASLSYGVKLKEIFVEKVSFNFTTSKWTNLVNIVYLQHYIGLAKLRILTEINSVVGWTEKSSKDIKFSLINNEKELDFDDDCFSQAIT